MGFKNPFGNDDLSDFPDIYEPLSDSGRQGSIGSVEYEKDKGHAFSVDEKAESNHDIKQYSATTVEGLRAEIMTGVASSGHDSMYDRMFCSSTRSMLAICRRNLHIASLTLFRQVKDNQHCYSGHWHGTIPMGALRSLRVRLAC